jgi:hypothetical protein
MGFGRWIPGLFQVPREDGQVPIAGTLAQQVRVPDGALKVCGWIAGGIVWGEHLEDAIGLEQIFLRREKIAVVHRRARSVAQAFMKDPLTQPLGPFRVGLCDSLGQFFGVLGSKLPLIGRTPTYQKDRGQGAAKSWKPREEQPSTFALLFDRLGAMRGRISLGEKPEQLCDGSERCSRKVLKVAKVLLKTSGFHNPIFSRWL